LSRAATPRAHHRHHGRPADQHEAAELAGARGRGAVSSRTQTSTARSTSGAHSRSTVGAIELEVDLDVPAVDPQRLGQRESAERSPARQLESWRPRAAIRSTRSAPDVLGVGAPRHHDSRDARCSVIAQSKSRPPRKFVAVVADHAEQAVARSRAADASKRAAAEVEHQPAAGAVAPRPASRGERRRDRLLEQLDPGEPGEPRGLGGRRALR